ncbi:HK97-gp10 family putative phage morphogenesis protein [Allorhizobium undicola]|uniref:HK97-gp10 family putative phage morphogenesis protein n=1 Tax=Allorhizobium undicola TaxID=78527 RepID=UPI000482AD29|nr:HK97-gp10 family putative phage morphogenesis protein [Allorhizobium undicola]
MAGASIKVEGLRELQAALAELPKATGRRVALRALTKAATPIADAGRANAPERKGYLKKSYGVGTKLTRRQRKVSKKESQFEVYAGPGGDPAGVQTEFGNEHQAAEPHLRPAWDANKDRALETIKEELWTEIEKAAQRLARKAAKIK